MHNTYLRFHHFGLAVRRPDEARAFLLSLGYRLGNAVCDPAQNVNLQLCTHATDPAVEIIWPNNEGGPIDKLIQRHTFGIVYHICYETENLAGALQKFDDAGLRVVCVSPPKSAPLFGGSPVSFYNLVGIGLIEILEQPLNG